MEYIRCVDQVFQELGEDEIKNVWNYIDDEIMKHVDARDNGEDVNSNYFDFINSQINFQAEYPYSISDTISDFNLSWDEKDNPQYPRWNDACDYVHGVMWRAVARAISTERARAIVAKASEAVTEEWPVIELPHFVPWTDEACKNKTAKIVCWPTPDKGWYAQVIPTSIGAKTSRIKFPSRWSDGSAIGPVDIAAGRYGLTFAHKGQFLIVAEDKSSLFHLIGVALIDDGMKKYF